MTSLVTPDLLMPILLECTVLICPWFLQPIYICQLNYWLYDIWYNSIRVYLRLESDVRLDVAF